MLVTTPTKCIQKAESNFKCGFAGSGIIRLSLTFCGTTLSADPARTLIGVWLWREAARLAEREGRPPALVPAAAP